MSRLFHTLVVAGAAISASACAGKSSRTEGDGDGGTGAGGTNAGGTGVGGSSGSGAVAGSGAVPAGGSAGSTGGTGVGGLPEPGAYAQWNCTGLVANRVCVATHGTTATPIPDQCPVELDRPRSASDCAAGELFTCVLAMTRSSELVLVNCYCEPADGSCFNCTNLEVYHGEPAYCDGVRKICACAYTGILR
jgi:hypothetical protein